MIQKKSWTLKKYRKLKVVKYSITNTNININQIYYINII